MARIHTSKRGKAGSSKPYGAALPVKSYDKKGLLAEIQKMAKEGNSKSYIGVVLRDAHAVTSVKDVFGKSLGELVEKEPFEIPEDLYFLVQKMKSLKKHLETHTRDTHNKRSLQLVVSKIRRLSAYYKRTGKISQQWRSE